jgi:hypothetical protein
MIVPQDRLLFWAGGGVLPLLTLAAAFPETAPPVLVVLAAFVGWVAVDAVGSRRHTRQLAVESPAVIRLAKGRPGTIPLRLTWSGPGNHQVRVGLALAGGVRPNPRHWNSP